MSMKDEYSKAGTEVNCSLKILKLFLFKCPYEQFLSDPGDGMLF